MEAPDRTAVPDPTVPAEALTEAIAETNQVLSNAACKTRRRFPLCTFVPFVVDAFAFLAITSSRASNVYTANFSPRRTQ
jgi:hypothetical protein